MQMNKIKIGVMGSAKRSKELPEELEEKAKIIGSEIAKQDCLLITGACMGTPHLAAEAASEEGGKSLGYSPGKDYREHREPPISYPKPVNNQIFHYSGLGKTGRNIPSIRNTDGVVLLGGGTGTLNEFTIAYHEGKVIGVLETKTSEATGSVERFLKSGGENSLSKKRKKSRIIIDDDPEKLVRKVIKQSKEKKAEPRKQIAVNFRSDSGNTLTGFFHLPKQEKPPAVILAHGFQRNKMGNAKTRDFVKLARKLRDEGYLVFRFDFEGCGDSEGELKNLTVAQEVRNLKEAVKVVKKRANIDHENLFLLGNSLGSAVASLASKKIAPAPKGLVFWTQGFNQQKLFEDWFDEQDIKEIKDKGYKRIGSKIIGRDYFEENVNKDYTSEIPENIPTLLIQGKADEEVPPESSQQIAQSKNNVELELIAEANHKFEGTRNKLIEKTINWIEGLN